MSNLIPFQFNTSSIRVVTTDDGEILFVARDVAVALGYANAPDAVSKHCKKAKSLKELGCAKHAPHANQELAKLDLQTKLIPESDVYRLTLRSKLESAETFQDWLVEEVIPSIRKTGGYSVQPPKELTRLELLQMAMDSEMAKQALQIEHDKALLQVETQAQEIEVLEPKAQALDRLSAAEGSMNITAAAKVLKMQPTHLFKFLSEKRWIYKRAGGKTWLGYQDKIQTGYLEHHSTEVSRTDGTKKVVEQVLVTAKGLAKLSTMLNAQPSLLDRAISLVTGKRNGLVSMNGGAK